MATLRLRCDGKEETEPDLEHVERLALTFKKLALNALSTMPLELYPEPGYYPPLN